MTEDQNERLVLAYEKLAEALVTLNDTGKRFYNSVFPEQHGPREAIVSHVPSEEDRLLEDQGATDRRPIREWLGGIPIDDPDEDIGPREREFLERQKAKENAGPKTGKVEGSDRGSVEAVGSETRAVEGDSSVKRNDKRGHKGTRRPKGGSEVHPILT